MKREKKKEKPRENRGVAVLDNKETSTYGP